MLCHHPFLKLRKTVENLIVFLIGQRLLRFTDCHVSGNFLDAIVNLTSLLSDDF